LIDSNISPVLFWRPGHSNDSVLRVSEIGSQADSTSAVSPEYERWVNRIMGWVRRRGTKVWGLQRRNVRPDLDIAMAFVSTIYALPDALAALEAGVPGRSSEVAASTTLPSRRRPLPDDQEVLNDLPQP
jgi:hypothetical protein